MEVWDRDPVSAMTAIKVLGWVDESDDEKREKEDQYWANLRGGGSGINEGETA